jgi:hypothetical protein
MFSVWQMHFWNSASSVLFVVTDCENQALKFGCQQDSHG